MNQYVQSYTSISADALRRTMNQYLNDHPFARVANVSISQTHNSGEVMAIVVYEKIPMKG